MHDFYCTDARQMYYPTLAQRVKYFKEDYEGVNTMCEAVREFFKDELAAGEALSWAKGREEGKEEGREAGREEGRAENLANNILNAYKNGRTISDIANFLCISEEKVKETLADNSTEQKQSKADNSTSGMDFFSTEK